MAQFTRKTTCPVTRNEFTTHAKPLTIKVGSQDLSADARTFGTGSLGWYANGKVQVTINGKPCTVQVGITLTLVGSKELPSEEVDGSGVPIPQRLVTEAQSN